MKLFTVTDKNADTLTTEELRDALKAMSVYLMDHGSLTIETGTLQSASLIRAWKEASK